MGFKIDELLTIVFTLFAVIDIVGSIPLLIAMKEKSGAIKSLKVTLISGALMILFLFLGKPFLQLLGLDVKSFAVGGSIVIFLLGLEMVLGHEIFKGDKNVKKVMAWGLILGHLLYLIWKYMFLKIIDTGPERNQKLELLEILSLG